MNNDKPVRRIGGKTLDEWEDEWSEMDGGFQKEHPNLHGVIGLYRADHNDVPIFIGYGTDIDGGGLGKRLQTLRSKYEQSGNNGPSAQFIRKNAGSLKLKVIKVGKGAGIELITKEICRELKKRHKIKQIRTGDTLQSG